MGVNQETGAKCGRDAMDGAFMFATSDRSIALGFIRKAQKNDALEDAPDSAGPFLDLIAQDVIRVQDPNFHPRCEIVPGMKWDESRRDEVLAICTSIFNGKAP